MNFAMWKKALNVIPEVSKEEWDALDIISKWLISTRAAVLIMTFISAALAGLFAWRDGSFNFLLWLALVFGLIMAHASNNIFNDYTDFVRGVDKDNYYRTMYGAQPVASGLMTQRQHLTYFAVTGILALVAGLYLVWQTEFNTTTWILLGLGAFFVLFYTWPLKGLALGEVAVLMVWGPLMIGGGYYVLTEQWNWSVVIASLPYVLGVTTVIFGKHIDKIQVDKAKKIYTLPVVIGEKAARYAIMAMMILPYLFTGYLIAIKFFTPIMLIVLLALPALRESLPALSKPKPETRPEGFPEGQGGWPLYFAPISFRNNRSFGSLFMLGLLLDLPAAELATRVSGLRAAVDVDAEAPRQPPERACALASPFAGMETRAFDLCAAQELHDLLLGQFDLTGIEELIVVPDGALEQLPFSLLVTGTDADGSPHWLIEDRAISTLPTTSSLRSRSGAKRFTSNEAPTTNPATATWSSAVVISGC